VGAAQADNPHRRTGFGEDQSMKAVPDITEREKRASPWRLDGTIMAVVQSNSAAAPEITDSFVSKANCRKDSTFA